MNKARMMRLAQSSYPAVQLALPTELRGLRDSEIEALVAERLPGATAEEVENFMRAMRSFGKAAGPIAQRALPGVISGASTGAVAGPWGAVIGGVVGGATSLLSSGRNQRGSSSRGAAPNRRPAPPAPTPRRRPPSAAPRRAVSQPPRRVTGSAQPTTRRRAPAIGGSDDEVVAATARLLLLLARPEVQQALLALLLGNSGRRSVRVGEQSIPIEALAASLAEASAHLVEATQPITPDSIRFGEDL